VTVTSATESRTKTLRRDAQRNRERIVAAARALFARDGLEASVDDITREAGVGMGTLYRHFPTKEELIDAVLEDAFDEVVGLAELALAEDDAWAGLRGFLEQVFALRVENRGLKDVIAAQHGPRADAMRARMQPLLRRMIERAQSQRSLRRDFAPEDMPLVFWTVDRVIETTAAIAPEAWRRQLALQLDGLRAEAASPLPRPPLTRAQLDRAAGRRR